MKKNHLRSICFLAVVLLLNSTMIFAKSSNFQLSKVLVENEVDSIMTGKWGTDFKQVTYPTQYLNNIIKVKPGASIQNAVNKTSAAGGGVVFLLKGLHVLESTIVLKSNVSIIGEGVDQTIVLQGEKLTGTAIFAEPEPQITDVLLKDFTLKGTHANKVNGFQMHGKNGSRHSRIMLQNIDLIYWAGQGVHMKRTDNIIMDHCNFQYNGSANGLYHNVYFLYNKYILQSDCDMSFPILGKGNKYTSVEYLIAQRCVIRACKGNGIQADHEEAGYLFFHKYDISDCGKVAFWFPCENYYDKYNYTDNAKYAPQKVILNRCNVMNNNWGAMWRAVNNSFVINCLFDNKMLDMGLLKCDVKMENSTFKKGNESYKNFYEWPSDVKLLW